tara:strand:+ start:4563 stop:5162 length:600 start_codon:yes stop_codon:yes gene_type:complete
MINFPYISWWQTSLNVVIEILDKSENPLVEKNNNILIFKDNKYDLQLDLLNDFKIEGTLTNPKTTKIFLLKTENLNWNKLLKNEKKYKYFISIDWDKFIEDELEDENNINNMMQGFDPSKLNNDQLDNLMKHMNNNELIVPDFNNPVKEHDEILEETQNGEQNEISEEPSDEDSPINIKTFDLDSIDETTENSISNLDK